MVGTSIGICSEGGFTLGSTTKKTPKLSNPSGWEPKKNGFKESILSVCPMC